MKTIFKGKRISAIYGILPETIRSFDDEMLDGRSQRNQKIKVNMGYGQRYRAKYDTTVSQLCIRGLEQLLNDNVVAKEEIGAIIVSTFTPDYFVPQVSNLIQGKMGLGKDVLTLDYWDGCSGFLTGIMHACMYLDHVDNRKVLLFTGDTMNRLQSSGEFDVYDEPKYGGDGASITIFEKTENESDQIPFVLYTEGKQRELIAHKMGGFYDIFHLNKSGRDRILEDPGSSFRFFQGVIPAVVSELMEYAKIDIGTVDGFSFIQANGLSGRKFADGLQLSYDKAPTYLVSKYGDLSATLNAFGIIESISNIQNENANKKEEYRIVMVGYGSGVKYGASLVNLRRDLPYGIIHTDL